MLTGEIIRRVFRDATGAIQTIVNTTGYYLNLIYNSEKEGINVQIKIGDETLEEVLAKKEDKASKGVASGYCELDSNTLIPVNRLPFQFLHFKDNWNANTNTPALSNGSGTEGDWYIVSEAGTTNIDGIAEWAVNDWIVRNNTKWVKIDNTDLVTSVNSKTGAVSLTTADVPASTDKNYCTDAEKTILTNQATVTTLKVCSSMADNAVINLPTCPNGGFLKVCTATGQTKFFIPATGIPEYESYYSAVFALASTAGKIGVFQVAGQAYACIENKTGGAVVVTYELEYGVVA